MINRISTNSLILFSIEEVLHFRSILRSNRFEPPPSLNRLESELRFFPSLTEIGFPFREGIDINSEKSKLESRWWDC
uniref:Uncharacterized protein n=1 Tax=Raphanus sativus TaxID=3726 RepID=A0A650GPR0_RAPSA|nr:hypothetical protein [Raphanus sativus]QGW48536.1 hypothetical protein [Raphanus sativus]